LDGILMAEAALDQKLGTLLRMHEEAFRQLGGVPEEILPRRPSFAAAIAQQRTAS
jgi:transposase